MSAWKISQYRPGDQVTRTYNGEPGHIMEIIHGNPPRYKVTSPSDPEGFTYEHVDNIAPSQSPPKAPPTPQNAPITMPPPPDPSQQQAQPMAPVNPMQQQPMSAVESKKKKCHYCHRQANTFYVYHVGVCHEHDPPPSTPPADVTPTPTSKVGWQIVKNPLKPAPAEDIKWRTPSNKYDFEAFVGHVMDSVGVSSWLPDDTNPNNYVRSPEFAKYHDLVLAITKGQVPKNDYGNYDNERRAIQEVAAQMPAILQNKIPNQDYRNVMDQQHANEFYNGIVPNDPSMRSQYPRVYPDRQSAWVLGSGESFQDAAAEELQKYEALARDIMRTLPEDQWPRWVKNQAHEMVWGPPKQVEWPNAPSPMDTQPTQTTFPEDWNF